jgi:hypothetical protein
MVTSASNPATYPRLVSEVGVGQRVFCDPTILGRLLVVLCQIEQMRNQIRPEGQAAEIDWSFDGKCFAAFHTD